jgi:ABC-type branched-subunit amino acid transport system substrate-binding protein
MRPLQAIAIAVFGTLPACGPSQTLPDGRLAPVRIGVITTLSGDLASLGPGWRNAALLAEQEVNAAGGVLPGRPLEMIVVDDTLDTMVGAEAADRLIYDDGVTGILGAAASGVSLSVAEVAYIAQVPQVSCCSTSAELTQVQPPRDRYFFRTVPSDLLQATVLANAAFDRFLCTRLAVMHLDNAYGTPFGEAIDRRFRVSLGGSVTIVQPFADARPSYSTEVNAVAATNPDCIALVGYPVSAGTILRDWDALPTAPVVTWIGTDGVKSDGFIEATGDPSLANGVVGTSPITAPATPQNAAFSASYRTVFGTDPIVFASNQYDAAALLALAIARAGSTDGPSIRDALYDVSREDGSEAFYGPGQLDEALAAIRAGDNVDYEGASGPVNLDDTGNVISNYEIWRYDSGMGAFVTDLVIQASEIRE